MADKKKDKRGIAEKPSKLLKFMQALITYSAAILFGMFSIRVMSFYNSNQSPSELVQNQTVQCPESPKFWGICLWNWNTAGNMRTMNRVFERLGYVSVNASEGDDWDILWTIEYPNKNLEIFDPYFKPLKQHQRVNHFLGITFITSKSDMASTNRDIKYILQGFTFPKMIDQFKDYVKANPNARFIEKAITNRGIKLVEQHEIIYDKSDKFYQLFMDKPFLVDGRFMDFAVYVLISSIDPLRIYRYEHEVYLRFCPEPYYPFDAKNLNKYVISDNRQLIFQLPETKKYFDDYGYSFKLAIENYFRKRGHNVTELWRKIDEAITLLVAKNEKHLIRETFNVFNSSHHFFEMVRFDFLLNEDLEPHISEVNMSPGVVHSEIEDRLSPTNEQLIYDTLKLVGAGSKTDLMAGYDFLTSEMISNSKNIAVNVEHCLDKNCILNCDKAECELCTPCLNATDINAMHRAHREHVQRGGYKRIFPSKIHFNEDFISKMSPRNQISTKWLKAKCEENSDWC